MEWTGSRVVPVQCIDCRASPSPAPPSLANNIVKNLGNIYTADTAIATALSNLFVGNATFGSFTLSAAGLGASFRAAGKPGLFCFNRAQQKKPWRREPQGFLTEGRRLQRHAEIRPIFTPRRDFRRQALTNSYRAAGVVSALRASISMS